MQAKFFDQSSFCTAERRHFLWTVKGTTFAWVWICIHQMYGRKTTRQY
jgi:hypothetical protein